MLTEGTLARESVLGARRYLFHREGGCHVHMMPNIGEGKVNKRRMEAHRGAPDLEGNQKTVWAERGAKRLNK